MNDNVYPNSTEFFFGNEPKEQKESRDKSENEVLAAIPLLEEHVKYLDKRIAFYGDVNAISIDLSEDPAAHRNRCLVNQMMKQELANERGHILAQIKAAMK